MLEDANLKLSSVMSDVMGVSGQEMLRAIVGGECDPAALAQLARKRRRGKIPVLRQAATGTLNEHPRFLIEQCLALWDELASRIRKFEERIEEQIRPFAAAVETWISLPGMDRITAWTIVAEMGPDMAQFPTVAHAASWTGLVPGTGGERGQAAKRAHQTGHRMAPPRAHSGRLGGEHEKGLVLQGVLPPAGSQEGKETSYCSRRPTRCERPATYCCGPEKNIPTSVRTTSTA